MKKYVIYHLGGARRKKKMYCTKIDASTYYTTNKKDARQVAECGIDIAVLQLNNIYNLIAFFKEEV